MADKTRTSANNVFQDVLKFTANEQYKLLRANLGFTLPEDEKHPVIGVTSSIRSEGKSTTSINLAYVIAEKGSKVLLIDGDLRIPTIATKTGISQKVGFTGLLMGEEFVLEDHRSGVNDNLYVLTAGEIPPNPSELLGSQRTNTLIEKMKEKFDYIIIDLPPVNLVSDTLAISKYITGLVVVVREDYTEKSEFDYCMRQLKLSKARIFGIVMNGFSTKSTMYRKYKKYEKQNSYEYSSSIDNKKQ